MESDQLPIVENTVDIIDSSHGRSSSDVQFTATRDYVPDQYESQEMIRHYPSKSPRDCQTHIIVLLYAILLCFVILCFIVGYLAKTTDDATTGTTGKMERILTIIEQSNVTALSQYLNQEVPFVLNSVKDSATKAQQLFDHGNHFLNRVDPP